MRKYTFIIRLYAASICLLFVMLLPNLNLKAKENTLNSLNQDFDLNIAHLPQPQYFIMESRLHTFGPNGTSLGTDVFRLWLQYIPQKIENRIVETYSCQKFTVQLNNNKEVELPALRNWTYKFRDDTALVFGINHDKFENLTDDKGQVLSFDKTYHIYNAFIDFHAFCNVFPEPVRNGKGVQNLTKIGQEIVHAAAFSKPPTNLGGNIAEGSFFKNGRIILQFKGLSFINGKACALLGIDSGESSFKMIVRPAADMDIVSTGRSHYYGDIYKDISTGWVQKVLFWETVVTETTMPMPPHKINSVVERKIRITNVSKERFYEK